MLLFAYCKLSRRVLSYFNISLNNLGRLHRTGHLVGADGKPSKTFGNLGDPLGVANVDESTRCRGIFHSPGPDTDAVGSRKDFVHWRKNIHPLDTPGEF